MSASVELQVDVTQCLDQVKQAFNDGGAILEKIKKKRALKRAPPPPRLLEESLDQAPAEIEKEKQRGLARFGKAFEDGDFVGIIHLQQITIQLQAALLHKLRNTAFDDDSKTTDFTYLSDVVDLGRDRTITALHELKQRLLSRDGTPTATQNATPNSSSSNLGVQSHVIAEEPAQQQQQQPKHNNARSYSVQVPQQHQPPPPTRHHKTWSRDFTHSRDASGEEDAVPGADENHHTSHHRKRSSLLHFLKHTRTTSSEAQKSGLIPPVEEPQRHASTSPTGPTSAPFQPPSAKSTNDLATPNPDRQSFTYEEWEDNPSEIWGSKPSLDRRETMALAPDAQNPNTTLARQSSNNSNQLNPPSPVLTNRSNSINALHGAPSMVIPTPNPENDYLGFCKGAWKLQNGDRKSSFGKCREVDAWSRHPSSAAAAHYLACNTNKCAFRSNFSNLDVNVIWSRVFAVPSKGIKLRWAFLAKSHVLQKVVVKHQYSFNCLFCVSLAGKSGVYHGIDYYLDHIASEHRGSRSLGEIILYKTGCIADHKADDTEEFDINLWPLEEAPHKPRQQSEWLNDDLLWQEAGHHPTGKEPNDSMFSANEPWNEGLSDFSYRGTLDPTELE